GIAETLAADAVTRELGVPHIDIAGAARSIVRLVEDRALLRTVSRAVKAKAQATFDMERYVAAIDQLGQTHATLWEQIEKDRALISEGDAFDAEFYLSPALKASGETAPLAHYLLQSHLLRPQCTAVAANYLRR